jgi:hypothetical protein
LRSSPTRASAFSLPASRVRLLAVLASFDTLLVELPRTLAPRDEPHSGQNDDHCNNNQNDRGGAHTVSPFWVVGPQVSTFRGALASRSFEASGGCLCIRRHLIIGR